MAVIRQRCQRGSAPDWCRLY